MMRFSIIIIILNESLTQKLESYSNDRAKSSIGKISEELLEDCISAVISWRQVIDWGRVEQN